jgi:hypothetical protein
MTIGRSHVDSVKNTCMSLPTGIHLVVVSFIISLKSNLYTAVTIKDIAENNGIVSHAPNTVALQPNVLSTGIHRLLVTNKGGRFYPAQTTAKVTCRLFSQYQWFS